jgi:hypothetical protein
MKGKGSEGVVQHSTSHKWLEKTRDQVTQA